MLVRTNSLILSLLTAASLMGCTDDALTNSEQESPRVRFEIEVYGEGEVVMVEPEQQVCDADDGLCSFSLPAGSRVRLEVAEVFVEDFAGWYDGCDGINGCELDLEQDTIVVADFDPAFRATRRSWDDCSTALKRIGASDAFKARTHCR